MFQGKFYKALKISQRVVEEIVQTDVKQMSKLLETTEAISKILHNSLFESNILMVSHTFQSSSFFQWCKPKMMKL